MWLSSKWDVINFPLQYSHTKKVLSPFMILMNSLIWMHFIYFIQPSKPKRNKIFWWPAKNHILSFLLFPSFCFCSATYIICVFVYNLLTTVTRLQMMLILNKFVKSFGSFLRVKIRRNYLSCLSLAKEQSLTRSCHVCSS